MKRILMSAILLLALSLLIVGATATDSSDDSKFLMIDHSNDFVSSGYIVYGAKNSRNIGSDESSEGGILMVNEAQAAYNSIDLSAYSTDDLVVFILNNRRSIGSMLYFSGSNPYEEAKSYFHGLKELETRDNALDTLLRAYTALKNATPPSNTERIEFRMRIDFLNLVLKSSFYSDQLGTNVIEPATSVDTQVVSRSTPSTTACYGFYYDYAGNMTTPSGNLIPLYSAKSDYTQNAKDIIAENLSTAHPSALLLGDATSAYNGYSYAWYQQSTSNNRCIFEIADILSDPHVSLNDSYGWDTCSPGDIIVYYNNANETVHAGVVYSQNLGSLTIESKWNSECLFRHDALDVPAQFFSDASIGYLKTYIFEITPHVYTVTSNGATGHTRTCNVCAKELVEAHSLTIMGTCRVCGYSGPSVMP